MKMNYQSGDKKNILGHRLSNRYLSSDAFTSSAGKLSGRSISRLGSMFKGHKSGRRYSGTGQKVGLFELKNIVLKLFFILTCIIILSYTIPFTRYAIHGFFAQKSNIYKSYGGVSDSSGDILSENEYYVSPTFLQTDRFNIDVADERVVKNGAFIFSSPQNVLIGSVEVTASNTPRVVLFSEVGIKNNFFFKNSILGDVEIESQKIETSTTTSVSTAVATTTSLPIVPDYTSIVFEGLGYGQMLAQVPPQVHVEVGTVIYARTVQGLKPAGRVSYVEADNGSTFTNIYAQVLTPPYALYKVRVADSI